MGNDIKSSPAIRELCMGNYIKISPAIRELRMENDRYQQFAFHKRNMYGQ